MIRRTMHASQIAQNFAREPRCVCGEPKDLKVSNSFCADHHLLLPLELRQRLADPSSADAYILDHMEAQRIIRGFEPIAKGASA
jgi:hypothetical protein